MNNIIKVSLLIICISVAQPGSAQRNEIGVAFGGSYYMGDLNPSLHFAMPRLAGGVIYRRNFNPHISARINALYASVQADDAIIGYNPERNLNFRSSIYELSVQAEINFLPFITGEKDNPSSFYLFGGGGGFRYNPKANYNGQWVELQKVGTESQNTEEYADRSYSLYSYNLLFGIGMKFILSESITAGIEWGMRRTGTDYLDDVSASHTDSSLISGTTAGVQRGNPYNNDWYSFAGIILTYRIKNPSIIKCHVY